MSCLCSAACTDWVGWQEKERICVLFLVWKLQKVLSAAHFPRLESFKIAVSVHPWWVGNQFTRGGTKGTIHLLLCPQIKLIKNKRPKESKKKNCLFPHSLVEHERANFDPGIPFLSKMGAALLFTSTSPFWGSLDSPLECTKDKNYTIPQRRCIGGLLIHSGSTLAMEWTSHIDRPCQLNFNCNFYNVILINFCSSYTHRWAFMYGTCT